VLLFNVLPFYGSLIHYGILHPDWQNAKHKAFHHMLSGTRVMATATG